MSQQGVLAARFLPMESAATKLVHAAAVKTLHAYNFSRSSSTAAITLSDLLARYLALLSESCAKYARHAGRTNLSVYDAVAVLDELGIGMDELADFCASEAKELNRYASNSVRRIEDLHEFRGTPWLLPLRVFYSFLFQHISLPVSSRIMTTRSHWNSRSTTATTRTRTRTRTWNHPRCPSTPERRRRSLIRLRHFPFRPSRIPPLPPANAPAQPAGNPRLTSPPFFLLSPPSNPRQAGHRRPTKPRHSPQNSCHPRPINLPSFLKP